MKEFGEENFKFSEKWRKFFQMGRKFTMWKKQKLLIMSNFIFTDSVL